MELTELLNKFINIYEENQIPNWITILSTVVPIIISIIVLWQNHIISKRNEDIQKDIAKNNEDIQKDIAKNNENLQEDLAEKNEKLQKDILNNEIKIKRYDIILNAYTAFIDAVEQLPTNDDTINSLILGGR